VITENRGDTIDCTNGLPNNLPELGSAPPILGNPNEIGTGTLFTGRILSFVNCVYQDANDPSDPTADQTALLLQVSAHELDHLLRNATQCASRFGGCHFKTGSGCVLDQTATYSTSGGVTFDIPDQHCAPTQDSIATGQAPDGATMCGDELDLADGDGLMACLPAAP
jgi:hypothetical protein